MYQNPPAQKSGLVPGLVVGLVAAVIGAGLYAVIIDVTQHEYSLATIAIGVLVGFAMMAVKPAHPALPAIAGVIALAGGIVGTFAGDVALAIKVAGEEGITLSYGDALTLIINNIGEFVDILTVLFWAIGAYAGFSFVNTRVKAALHSAGPATEPATGAPAATAEGHAPQAAPTIDAPQGEAKEAGATEATKAEAPRP